MTTSDQPLGPEPGIKAERSPGGALAAGPIFAPVYVIDGAEANRVLIDDPAFVSTTDDREAALIAIKRRVDTHLGGLVWTKKVGVVTLKGILCRKGRVGPFDVLYFAGPIFDGARRADDKTARERAAQGLPTGEPGSRRIIVTTRKEL